MATPEQDEVRWQRMLHELQTVAPDSRAPVLKQIGVGRPKPDGTRALVWACQIPGEGVRSRGVGPTPEDARYQWDLKRSRQII